MVNERVKGLVEAYQAEQAKAQDRAASVELDSDRLQRELTEARRELDAATDAAIEDGSAAKREAERKARQKVAALEIDLTGVEHRTQRAFLVGAAKKAQLGDEAIRAGREEAEKHYRDNIAAVQEAIADAKYAYLMALVSYYTLRREANGIYNAAVIGTTGNDSPSNRPSLAPELLPFYIHGSRQVHGILPDEIERAFKDGTVLKRSVGEGREIERGGL